MKELSFSRRTLLFAGLSLPLIGCASLAQAPRQRFVRVDAPFDMPAIAIPDFSAAPRFFNLTLKMSARGFVGTAF